MSRNSKGAQRNKAAKERSEQRKKGNAGPAKTTPKHNKKRAWWQLGTYSEAVKGGKGRKREGESS
jgi:hypothetical protein